MKSKASLLKTTALFSAFLVFALLAIGAVQQPTTDERVAAIKQSLQKSMQQVRQYQWTETTAVSLKGEEKSRTQNSCAYGADGKVQKTPTSAPAEAKEKRGLRGKVVEKKTEEMSDYMKKAVSLIHAYVPPDPAKIQACKDAGKVGVQVLEPDKRVQVQFRDYHQAGDMLGIELDITKNLLLGYQVTSFIEKPEDAVNLNVRFATLADETIYAADVVLDVKAKEIKVNVQNSDYRKAGQ
jgi:hypothetical protein